MWNQFRSNIRKDGYADELGSLTLSWMKKIGECVSSPIADNDILYIANMLGIVYAIDIKQNSIIWRTELKIPVVSTPIVHDNMLYLATFDTWIKGTKFKNRNYLIALDIEEGKVRWNADIKGDIFASPTILNDEIIIGALDGYVYAFDMNGNIRWKIESNAPIWSSPAILNDKIIIGSDDNNLYCMKDGDILWKVKLAEKVRSSTPCITPSSILIGSYDGSVYCLDHYGNIR